MPFTSKEIAEYTELINDELDKIPVNSTEDVTLIVNALEEIARPGSKYKEPDEFIELQDIQLKEFMSSISGICNNPEFVYAHEAEFPEFQKIIQQRIFVRINEFKNMSLTEKESYIHSQQSSKATVQAAAAAMKNVTESKAWTEKQQAFNTGEEETEQQMLARRQREFQAEGIPAIYINNMAEFNILQQVGISISQLSAMNPAILAALIGNADGAAMLIRGGISSYQLSIMEPAICTNFLQNAQGTILLKDIAHISLEQLIAMSTEIRTALLQNAQATIRLISFADISLEQLTAISPEIRNALLQNSSGAIELKGVNINLEQLIGMNPEARNALLQNSSGASDLINILDISLKQLLAMNPEIRNGLLENAEGARKLIENLEQLLETDPQTCTEFLQNAKAIKKLMKHAHIDFDRLVMMDPEIRSELIRASNSFIELNKTISLEQLERLNREQVHTLLSDQNSEESSEILSTLKRSSRKPWM